MKKPPEGGHAIQQRETRRETRGDKTSGRQTHHPTKGNKKGYTMGDKGRQDPGEGGHAIQQRETRRQTMGDKGRQDLGKADAPSNNGRSSRKRAPGGVTIYDKH